MAESINNDKERLDTVLSCESRVSRRDMIKHDIDFLRDDPSTMTFARRAALHLMKRYSWYNPQLAEQQQQESAHGRFGSYSWHARDETVSSQPYIEMDEISNDGSFNKSMLRSPTQRERPSLEKAWAYFEHVTLPRYLDHKSAIRSLQSTAGNEGGAFTFHENLSSQSNNNSDDIPIHMYCYDDSKEVMDLAEPGEDSYPTKLYSPFWTPTTQMGDFGLGVGLYFSALRSVMIMTFIAGLFNIPNMIYFSSEKYSQGQHGVDAFLRGSAVCTVEEFVPCPTCSLDYFADVPHRIAIVSNIYSDVDLVFVLKNYCDGAKLPLALVNFATLLLVMYGVVHINSHLKQQEVMFDEDEQTAQDYSVVVKNPPPDATDPDEWKTFFDTNFGPDVHVTCCTITKDNYQLIRALVRRREILQKLKWKLPPGTPLDIGNLAVIVHEMRETRSICNKMKAMIVADAPEMFEKLIAINAKVKKLAAMDFPVTRSFITFETEKAQRHILQHLSVGSKLVRKFEMLKPKHPGHLFRNCRVLHVKEAEEPSTIRWHDLSDMPWERALRYSLTAYCWGCAMIFVVLIVQLCHNKSAKFAAYAIAFCNGAFPEFARLLVNFESHQSEGKLQTSLYVKIAAFRWINTAIIVTLITPFTSTISKANGHLIDSIRDIFVAEIVMSNIIKFSDPVGFFNRHYMAPRAQSQEEMNSYMRGDEWYLAERYTNMSKIVFLTLWYSSIYPFGFFLCALALFINYFAERYSIMRTWMRAPSLGSSISSFTRRYFFILAVSAMALSCSYSWAGFPYDNLCRSVANDSKNTLKYYTGSWSIESVDGTVNADVTVSDGDPSYKFCHQSLYWNGKGFNFPAIPYWQSEGYEWMTEEQELLTSFYGWSSFAVIIGAALWLTRITARAIFFHSTYEACGEDQGIPFSDVGTISSYIPQVRSALFSYPLLAVDTDQVEEELYEWKDPDRPYSYYDLTRDARQILKDSRSEEEIKSLFSTVMHWNPSKHTPTLATVKT